jgi:outer membrane putative beta-barrel porin/alpha-amylase
MKRCVIVLCAALMTASVGAQELDQDHAYTFFHPTPRELWREMSADRPDFTESPITVNAGVIQLEMSFFDYTRNGRAESFALAPANLKFGLLDDMDVQLVFVPYAHDDDGVRVGDGFGDTQVRLKMNFWGNDGERTAFAIMPFVKVPTATGGLGNDHVEGGVIFPFSVEVREGVGLGLMFETDIVYHDSAGHYDAEFIVTGVVGVDMTDKIGAYIEGIGIASTDSGTDFRSILGLGATYSVSANMVFDIGMNIGLGGDADDVNIFSGITMRF